MRKFYQRDDVAAAVHTVYVRIPALRVRVFRIAG
jgi:hypothetical protein